MTDIELTEDDMDFDWSDNSKRKKIIINSNMLDVKEGHELYKQILQNQEIVKRLRERVRYLRDHYMGNVYGIRLTESVIVKELQQLLGEKK